MRSAATETPRHRLAAIPADLLRRRETARAENTNARKLIRYLEIVGIRPTFAEVEEERRRRDRDGHHPKGAKPTTRKDTTQ